ncbi:MAG: aminomethyl-transferring glycine dehydrogenase subunit GcvPA [Candidatus Dormibacteraceae bacterium]
MPYLVHDPADRQAMLAEIGVASMEELLVDIPASLRRQPINLPEGLSELEVLREIEALAGENRIYADRLTFRGGGVYRRFIPAAVAAVIAKPEFATAYTPYQAEASQGTLQAMFEYQTLIAELTALDVANASLYDGATALVEAAMIAVGHTGRKRVAVLSYLHPEYLEVLRCYGEGQGFEVDVLDPSDRPNEDHAALLWQQPDWLGRLHADPQTLSELAHQVGALAVVSVDPISLALLSAPGEYGADIAVGEGQQLGMPPLFGGPHLGFIACTSELVRRMPGRLVGQAEDESGRRGFVLTLSTREQHIRRGRASSNICTNHSLCALAASVYLTYMGAEGLEQVATIGAQRAHALAERLVELPGIELAFPEHHFLNEFALRVNDPEALLTRLNRVGILGGLRAERWYPEQRSILLFCCTEVNDPAAIDQLVEIAADE